MLLSCRTLYRYVLCDVYVADRKSGSGGGRGFLFSLHLPRQRSVGAKSSWKIPCTTLYTLFLYGNKSQKRIEFPSNMKIWFWRSGQDSLLYKKMRQDQLRMRGKLKKKIASTTYVLVCLEGIKWWIKLILRNRYVIVSKFKFLINTVVCKNDR